MILAAAGLKGREGCAQPADGRVRESVSRHSLAHSPEWKPHWWKSVIRPGGARPSTGIRASSSAMCLRGKSVSQSITRLHAFCERGEMFYEPTGALHSTSENAQPGMPAKILAFMVAPPGRPVVEGK